MLPQIDGLSLSPAKVFSILIFHLLIHLNRAESQVVGPHQPVVALVDDDVILPCHVEPAEDVTAEILEWTRSDLNPRFVHVWRSGQDLVNTRNPSYRGRSSLFINELKRGNISLKLSKVKLSDEGTYECSIPLMEKKSFVNLVVASHAARSLLISLSGTGENRGGVVLQCESAGWYPEPELLWLDGEGNLLSAGPTETLRGPDDLYTVSSRVTVEKRHSNNINCRVQQKQISKSRETHKHVPGEFFELTSCSAAPIVIGLAVSLAVSIILILIGVFFIWRQNKTNVRRAHCDACKEEETANRPESDKTERDQEQDKLMSQDIVACEKNQHAAEEKLKEADVKLKEAHRQLEKKDAEISNMKKECEKNQHAAEEKLKEEHRQLEKKDAEISNMKKEEENQEADKMLKDDKKQDFQQQEAKQPEVTEVERPLNTPEHETPKRTNTNTFVATNQTRAKESAGWRPPAGTEQKPQESAVTSSQAQPAADCTTADRPLSPETQDPRAPHTPTGAHQSQGGQTRPSSCQLEKNQHAAEKLKEEHHHLQKKHAEISNMKKEPDTSKPPPEKSQTSFEEQNKSGSANHSSKTGDITVVEVETNGSYICLKNTSSENKLLSGWKLKLQINNRESATYEFKENFILKAGETLLLRQDAVNKPIKTDADLLWMNMVNWNTGDDVKIDLISNTGEEQMLFKNKIM